MQPQSKRIIMNNKHINKMKKIYNYIMICMLAFVSVSCSDEETDTQLNPVKSGDEVQFGLSLGNSARTVYGPEANNAFPIYWVNGDKVQIFSPECLEGRRDAEYEVSVTNNTQNYADALTKTGEYGVQWGNTTTANFYSLYPSGKYELSSDGTKAENITISDVQHIGVNGSDVKSYMEDCLMYAKKYVDTTLDTYKGVVELQYDPISTVLWVTLNTGTSSDATKDTWIIQSISVTATDGSNDVNIAGKFSLNISDGSFGEFAEGKNTVQAMIVDSSTGAYYTMGNNGTLSIPLFIAPVSGLNVKNWKIQVVANNNTYTKTLGIDKTLEPGQIHKITLPTLSETTSEWEVSSWMKNIPRNVYLSEISIPGTWNSLNVDCQSVTTIADQYALGVRAFHLDTRWKSDNSPYVGSVFTGISTPTITTLSVATGGSGNTYKYDDANVMRPGGSSFAYYLKKITENVREDEYMIVFCTFAQNSYNGSKCPSTWYKAISDACAENGDVYDASSLTANTLVGDVLDKVIVIVNLDSTVDSATLPEGSKCLFTYVPMNLPSDHYTGDNATASGHIDALQYSTKASSGVSMYTSHSQISTTGTSSVDCSDRGYSHPLTSRDALVTSIWDCSKSNYGTSNYAHDKWIYLGLGGYIMTSSSSSGSGYDTIENRYAPMVYNRIEAMGKDNVPYYPVGIILMNNKKGSNYTNDSGTDLGYGFSDVCEQVLLLNNKYRLQYDATKPVDYNPNTTPATQSDYDSYSTYGGDVIELN